MTDYEDDQLKEENARKQRDMAQREIDDIRFVMSCEQGRRVVWSVLEKGVCFPLSRRWTLWQWHLMRGNAIWLWNCFSALWRIALNSI
ncbi:hypothetical protein VEV11M_11670 [Escherichia coli]|nr:hypothetical protein VEV11M_11670 [Escherichia coli]